MITNTPDFKKGYRAALVRAHDRITKEAVGQRAALEIIAKMATSVGAGRLIRKPKPVEPTPTHFTVVYVPGTRHVGAFFTSLEDAMKHVRLDITVYNTIPSDYMITEWTGEIPDHESPSDEIRTFPASEALDFSRTRFFQILNRRSRRMTIPTKTAFDADSGELVPVTPEQQQRAAFLHRHIEASTLVTSVALAEIADQKHHLALGCSSFAEYSRTMLSFGYRSAKNYVQIGRKFAALLPQVGQKEGKPVSLLLPAGDAREGKPVSLLTGPDPDLPPNIQELSGLGTRKLLDLVRMEDAVFEEVIEKGELKMPDGEIYTIEDLREMPTAELTALRKEKQRMGKKYPRQDRTASGEEQDAQGRSRGQR